MKHAMPRWFVFYIEYSCIDMTVVHRDDTAELEHLEQQPRSPSPTYINYGTSGSSPHPPVVEESSLPPRLPTRRYKRKQEGSVPGPSSGATNEAQTDGRLDKNIQVYNRV